jgi:hypothetical protein
MLTGLITAFFNLVIGAAGAVGGLAIALSTKYGERLIGHKFDERLEAFKGGVQREVEQLKSKLALLGDRGVRSNEREYAAIIVAREQLMAAQTETVSSISMFLQHADISRMSDADADFFLKANDVSPLNAKAILGATDRNDALSRYLRIHQLNKAQNSILDGFDVVRKQSVFIPKDIEDDFVTILSLFSDARLEAELNMTPGLPPSEKMQEGRQRYRENAQNMIEELKDKIRKRIHVNPI